MKFLSALAILFIALKLCGVIGWSWWLVLLPLYGGLLLTVIILLLGGTGIFGWALFETRKQRKNKLKR